MNHHYSGNKQNVGSVSTTEEHLLVCINVSIIGKHSKPEILFMYENLYQISLI